MAIIEPGDNHEDNDNMKRIFAQMTDDLNLDTSDIEKLGAVTVSSLSDFELSQKFNEAKRELYKRGELMNPKTDTGKDLHAVYHGCLLEMKHRGLM